ncbi:MAG: hypothetical protein ABL888_00120 [Pirellulaceae bacterium]
MRTMIAVIFGVVLASVNSAFGQRVPDSPPPSTSTEFRYYRLGNTGIQGDWNEAIWVGPDGDPWIGGYDPIFEEGGMAKLIQAEDRFVNLSNVDFRILGHPNNTGTVRVQDIVADRRGVLWFPTWTAVFSYDPKVGSSSLKRYDLDGPGGTFGGAADAEVAPDGTMWVARGFSVGVDRFNPSTRQWTHWDVLADHLAIQPKPSGGYYVWAEYHFSFLGGVISRYDSATGVWTDMPADGGRGRIFILQEKDAVDDAGNVWAYDIGDDVFNDPLTLGYLRPDAVWVEVPTPWPLGELNECAAFKAYGNGLAICASSGGTIFAWDGDSWSDLGIGGGGASAVEAVDIDVATGTVWTAGAGGAAKRDPLTGHWQRYRITNCSQGDNFVLDLSLTPTGEVWTTANISPGIGGFQHFDGTKWRGFNQFTYSLPGTGPFPFPSDSTQAIVFRPSNGHVALGMPGGGVQEWTGTEYIDLGLSNWYPTRLLEDSQGRLWAFANGFTFIYSGGAWQELDLFSSDGAPAADPDRPGWVWITGWDGSVRTDGTIFEKTLLPELPNGSAPIGNGQAWVGSGSGLYLVNMVTKTFKFFGTGTVRGTNPRPFGVSPDGILWYGCDEGLGWLGTKGSSRRQSGIFHAPPGGVPQWGGLAWWPQRGEIRVTPNYYEIWMTTPSRGITVLRVSPR